MGAIVALGGFALAVRSVLLLMGRGRPIRGPRPAFVIAGPYVKIRNPLLGGVLLGLAGLALATRAPGVAVATIAAAVLAHVWVVFGEEPRLRRRFGPTYEAYLARVPRWIPRREAERGGDAP